MRFLFTAILPVVVAFLFGVTLLEFRAHLLATGAIQQSRAFRQQLRGDFKEEGAGAGAASTEGGLRALQVEEDETRLRARRAATVAFAELSAVTSYASLLRHIAELKSDPKEQIQLYCEALSNFGSAIRRDPFSGRLLMSWANIRQILGRTKCELPLTDGNYQEALVRALQLDPNDTESRYAAGLLLLWGNATDQAWQLFQQVLRFSSGLNEAQEKTIFSQIKDERSLRAIVPARFPQILRASQFLLAHPLVFGGDMTQRRAFEAALAKLQNEAVQVSIDEYSRDQIPFTVHAERLVALSGLVGGARSSATEVRKTLDQQLSTLMRRRGERALSDYLAERASLNELSVVLASEAGDTRPTKSSLVSWGAVDRFYFDEFYRSIGFFLGPQQGVRVVELSFDRRPSSTFASSLRLFQSEDNENWTEISSSADVKVFEIGAKALVAVRIPTQAAKYWKLHFASANHDRLLLGSLDSSVRVYGLSPKQGLFIGEGGDAKSVVE